MDACPKRTSKAIKFTAISAVIYAVTGNPAASFLGGTLEELLSGTLGKSSFGLFLLKRLAKKGLMHQTEKLLDRMERLYSSYSQTKFMKLIMQLRYRDMPPEIREWTLELWNVRRKRLKH